MMSKFLADGVVPATGPIKWDATHGVKKNKWGMDDNAELGCCGFAMWDHYNVAKTGNTKLIGKSFLPNYLTLKAAYYAYGISQGEPPPHPDFGVSNATMFAWAYKLGLIDGYGEVPLNSIDYFGMTFNGVGFGTVIDGDVANNDFNSIPRLPWDKMAKKDGHDILGVAGDGLGGNTAVTWGSTTLLTPKFVQFNITDAWVMFDKDDPAVNWPKLQSALDTVHGVRN
jgi:hypothetical protein